MRWRAAAEFIRGLAVRHDGAQRDRRLQGRGTSGGDARPAATFPPPDCPRGKDTGSPDARSLARNAAATLIRRAIANATATTFHARRMACTSHNRAPN